MSDRFFDPSDAVDIPDEAEPWENRPEAVMDDRPIWVKIDDIREVGFASHADAVRAAHAILSEVEIAQKERP